MTWLAKGIYLIIYDISDMFGYDSFVLVSVYVASVYVVVDLAA